MGTNTEKNQNKLSPKSPEFRLQDHTFEENTAPDFNYELWKMAHASEEDKSSTRYFASSMLIHALLAAAALTSALTALQERKMETVEIEIMDPGVVSSPSAPIAKAPAIPEVTTPPPTAPKLAKDEIVVPAKVTKASKAKPSKPAPKMKVYKPAPPAPKPAKAAFKPAKVQTFKSASPVVLPDSVDDIKAPDLDDSALDSPAAKLDESELQQDFKKVDEVHKQKIAAVAQDLDKESESALAETEQLADNLNSETEAEAEKIAAYNASRRARDAQAIAAAEAAERAAAARAAAQARAEQEKAGIGGGAGNAMPTGIRHFDQLRQRPGNPRPQYDNWERLQRQQGDVNFIAYVNEAGVPTQFKMLKSTGFRNLDAKTLKAIKQWRFYPGQAGWVEFPFKWDLKGGPREMPALLRRK